MDYLAEIANSADLIEALGRISPPDVAKSLLDLNHPYGSRRQPPQRLVETNRVKTAVSFRLSKLWISFST